MAREDFSAKPLLAAFEDNIGEGPPDIDPDPGFSSIFAQSRIFCGRLFFEKRMIIYHSLNLLSINLPKFFFIYVPYMIKKYVSLRIDLILICL